MIAVAITLFFVLRGHRRKSAQSASNTRRCLTATPVPMWIFDRATLAFLDVNGAAVKQYGYTKGEFLTITLRDIRPASEQAIFNQYVAKEGRDSRKETTWKHCKKNGGLIFVQVKADNVSFKGRLCRLAMANDITETILAEESRKKAEAATREALSRFEALSSATNDAIRNWDIIDNQLKWNHGLRATFGYPAENSGVLWWFRRVHPDDRHEVKQCIREMAMGQPLNDPWNNSSGVTTVITNMCWTAAYSCLMKRGCRSG